MNLQEKKIAPLDKAVWIKFLTDLGLLKKIRSLFEEINIENSRTASSRTGQLFLPNVNFVL